MFISLQEPVTISEERVMGERSGSYWWSRVAGMWENTSLLFPFVFQIFQVEEFFLTRQV